MSACSRARWIPSDPAVVRSPRSRADIRAIHRPLRVRIPPGTSQLPSLPTSAPSPVRFSAASALASRVIPAPTSPNSGARSRSVTSQPPRPRATAAVTPRDHRRRSRRSGRLLSGSRAARLDPRDHVRSHRSVLRPGRSRPADGEVTDRARPARPPGGDILGTRISVDPSRDGRGKRPDHYARSDHRP
jgi:hypothetical protein